MKNLVVQDMRCFHAEVVAPLAPLTILVGENSAGKSTFLAATRLAWDIAQGSCQPDFNEEPFTLGAYDQIANLRGGAGGRSKSFAIGFEFDAATSQTKPRSGNAKVPAKVTATFVSGGAQPQIKEWNCQSKSHSFGILFPSSDEKTNANSVWKFRYQTPSGVFIRDFPTSNWSFQDRNFDPRFLHFLMSKHSTISGEPTEYKVESAVDSKITSPTEQELELLRAVLMSISQVIPSRPYAMAPIRTEPLRTYHPARETSRASGAHIPMVLAEMSGSDADSWTKLKRELDDFGLESGLFRLLNIKRLGKKLSDPFQVEIKVSGKPFNLVDVGYGVSQALPILVDSLMSDHKFFLMQQPEVHLHPKAQAALGTLLGHLVKRDKKRFIVETHSDYILDRIRLDIRDKKTISPDDVLILYFERTDREVVIHPIHIDELGNVIDAPPCYREFFLAEERRFFGV